MAKTPVKKEYKSVRGKHGVGKVLGRNKWVHASALPLLSAKEQALVNSALKSLKAQKQILIDLKGQDVIIKINLVDNGGAVTFCYSPDWKVATEPACGQMIGASQINSKTPKFRVTSPAADPYIYHHKWMFVADNYRGFNVEQAKRWSESWENHPVVKTLATKPDEHFRLRIGKQKYWQTKVLAPILRKQGK